MNDHGDQKEQGRLEQLTFEEALSRLEEIVDKLETKEVALEEAIALFQKGMELSNVCHEKLKKVEKQVQLILEEEGKLVKKAFHLEEDPS